MPDPMMMPPGGGGMMGGPALMGGNMPPPAPAPVAAPNAAPPSDNPTAPSPGDMPPNGAGEGPDFDLAMQHLVMAALQDLHEPDLKVLSKLGPDLAFVLSKIFGGPAIDLLRQIGQSATANKGMMGQGPSVPAPQPGVPQPQV